MSGLDAGFTQLATWSVGTIAIAIGTLILVMGGIIAAATHRMAPFMYGVLGMLAVFASPSIITTLKNWVGG